jgi:hypothetical protein
MRLLHTTGCWRGLASSLQLQEKCLNVMDLIHARLCCVGSTAHTAVASKFEFPLLHASPPSTGGLQETKSYHHIHLCGQLLAWSLASCALASCLLGTGHVCLVFVLKESDMEKGNEQLQGHDCVQAGQD